MHLESFCIFKYSASQTKTKSKRSCYKIQMRVSCCSQNCVEYVFTVHGVVTESHMLQSSQGIQRSCVHCFLCFCFVLFFSFFFFFVSQSSLLLCFTFLESNQSSSYNYVICSFFPKCWSLFFFSSIFFCSHPTFLPVFCKLPVQRCCCSLVA